MKYLILSFFSFFCFSAVAHLEPLPRHLLATDWNYVRSEKRLKAFAGPQAYKKIGIDDLPHLLPRVFMIETPSNISESTRNLQVFTDHILEKILKTPTGHRAALIYSNGVPGLLQHGIGLSVYKSFQYGDLYQKEAKQAGNWPPKPFQYTNLEKFMFIFTEEKNLRFDSWTDHRDSTFLPITPRDSDPTCKDCDERLYRIFAHEFAQVVDGKTVPMSPEELRQHYRGNSACAAQAAIYHPIIRLAFGAWRAFQVEELLLKEMGHQGPSVLSSLQTERNCSAKLAHFIESSSKYRKILKYDYITQSLYSDPQCAITSNDITLTEALQIIEREVLQLPSQEAVSLCEFYSRPGFDYAGRRPLISRGPRPNIGNGTGRQTPTLTLSPEPSLQQASRESRQTAIELMQEYVVDQKNTLDPMEMRDAQELIKILKQPSAKHLEDIKKEKPSYLRP
jgi:hypothetical protein